MLRFIQNHGVELMVCLIDSGIDYPVFVGGSHPMNMIPELYEQGVEESLSGMRYGE